MEIVLTATEKGGEHSLPHDLNFQSERYEAKHNVVSLSGGMQGFRGHMPFADGKFDSRLDLQEPEARTRSDPEGIRANIWR